MGGDGFFSQVSAKNRKTKATPTEMSAYPNLFNKEGYMRIDADKYAKELKSSMDVLYERAYGDKNFRDVQRNWDVVAEKNRQQFIANSSSAIEQSDFAFDEIDNSYPIPLTLSLSLSISIVTILLISFMDSELNIIQSSTLFRNSGAKVFFNAL